MGKFNETKWAECLQREMEMAPLDVVRGYARDGLTLRLAAETMECPIPFLRSLCARAGIRFEDEGESCSPVCEDEFPVQELATLTGLTPKTIKRRIALGIPRHRLVAADWPDRVRHGPGNGPRETSPTRAERVRAHHARAGRLPVSELASLTGIDRKTIERRQERGLPKHRLVAADWPGRQGGRKAKP